MNSVKLQDTKAAQKNQLHFYTLTKSYPKKKLRNQSHLQQYQKNETLRNKLNQRNYGSVLRIIKLLKETERTDLWTWGEGEMYGKSNMETYITICKITDGNLLYGSGNSNRGSVSTQKGGKEKETGGSFKRKGIYVYLWLIHVEV